ncbi:MAG: hypothetical protein HC827_03340 [Cyanobacteria bacterium RM1_2_2]|nr:hypothetical protein [Cyanobacteria bacterium RM1_2_2]
MGKRNEPDSDLGSKIETDPLRYLRKRMYRAGNRFYGCEIKFFHLDILKLDLKDFVDQLSSMGFTHFIVLERKNYLRKIVSSKVAKLSQYHIKPGEAAPSIQIHLDPQQITLERHTRTLIEWLEEYQNQFNSLEKLLEDYQTLKLTYEEDISSSPRIAYQQVLKFIGIEVSDENGPAIRYAKTNSRQLSQIITNFDEVEAALRKTPFEWMLCE